MTGFFYLSAVILSAWLGLSHASILYIAISCLFMTAGYVNERSGQLYGLYKDDGFFKVLKGLVFVNIPYLIILVLIYYIASVFS